MVPWTEKDLNAKHEYNNITEGAGALYTWVGDKKSVGEGSMEILESSINRVKSKLEFKGRGVSSATVHITPINESSCKVTWDFEADNKNNPIARIFGRMMDKFLGPDYEKGLSKLKNFCEK